MLQQVALIESAADAAEREHHYDALARMLAVAALTESSEPGPSAPKLITLSNDLLAAILVHTPDDTLAFALTCRALNNARPAGRIRTRVLATLRSPALQAWATTLGCPRPYPYWAEIHGLTAAPQYNGRVGRVLAPPNDNDRMPVEVDAGIGQLPRRDVIVSATGQPLNSTLIGGKPLLVRTANLHPLTLVGEELVRVVYAASGGGLRSSRTQVLVPRRHTCFQLDLFVSDMLASDRGFDIGLVNANMGRLSARGDLMQAAQTHRDPGAMVAGYRAQRVGLPGRERERGSIWREEEIDPRQNPSMSPLSHARWAHVHRSPLLHQCGVPLVVHRTEQPGARSRSAMQNRLATFLMIDVSSGFAPPDWQDDIGDVYIYKPAVGYTSPGRAVEVPHTGLEEVCFMWGWIYGELGGGEAVHEASAEKYQQDLRRYLEREGGRADGLAPGAAASEGREDVTILTL